MRRANVCIPLKDKTNYPNLVKLYAPKKASEFQTNSSALKKAKKAPASE
jgi:hypothetical protein